MLLVGVGRAVSSDVVMPDVGAGTVLFAGDWHGENDNDFMWGDYNVFHTFVFTFFEDHDEYPHHFIMHLIHCSEVVGYKHPDIKIKNVWNGNIRFQQFSLHCFRLLALALAWNFDFPQFACFS